jgi:hypothetical protein
MAKHKPADVMSKVVAILEPLPSEERVRVVRAAMVILGETQSPLSGGPDSVVDHVEGGDVTSLSPRARVWMKQNTITVDELQQVFHMTPEGTTVIASHMPGKDKKEQTYNAYILTGIAQLLSTGTPSFEDKAARALCESSGCYDSANHAAHLKKRGNEFTGTKEKGWTLTAPGLKRGAEIIKVLNKSEE